MSTNSVVAVPSGDAWRGRYVHWDGYPQWSGEVLCELVRQHGVDAARTTLTEAHPGWSSIDLRVTDIAGVEPDVMADIGTPGYWARMCGPRGPFSADRFTMVPGWGVAYRPSEQADVWVSHDSIGDAAGFIEWVYVLGDTELFVFNVDHTGASPVAVLVGAYRYEADTNWEAVEDTAKRAA